MSEYPWDIENTMLSQHEQPCDCAICDEIHFNRETRRNKRNDFCPVKERGAAYDLGYRAAKAEFSEKCNIYKCMDRKDLKLRIEQLHKQVEDMANRGEADTLYWKGKASDFRSALDRIACGYWNEAQCHTIAKAALSED